MTTWRSIGTAAKVVAIVLGVGSLVHVIQTGFNFTFNVHFQAVLTFIAAVVDEVTAPFELLIRALGLRLDLNSHWKQAFVLLWLFNAKFTATVASQSRPFESAARWIWATITSLFGGVMAGKVGLSDLGVLWWPVCAFFVTWSGNFVIDAIFKGPVTEAVRGLAVSIVPASLAAVASGWIDVRALTLADNPPPFWWALFAWFMFWAIGSVVAGLHDSSAVYKVRALFGFLLAAVAGVFAVGLLATPTPLRFDGTPSPGLVNLAVFVAAVPIWFLALAYLFPIPNDNAPGYRPWFKSHPVRSAVEILSIFFGAMFLAYFAAWLA